jgi:hypothetical protein
MELDKVPMVVALCTLVELDKGFGILMDLPLALRY